MLLYCSAVLHFSGFGFRVYLYVGDLFGNVWYNSIVQMRSRMLIAGDTLRCPSRVVDD